MYGDAAFGAWSDQVFEADVGKGASSHDSVITATSAVLIEVFRFDALSLQVFSGGTVGLDGPGRADVVGGC